LEGFNLMHDIAFYTHAIPETGFGHAARCVNTVKVLQDKYKGLDIVFIGKFSKSATTWINSQVSIKFVDSAYSSTAVYDRMDDTEFPDRFSECNINYIKNKCNKLIFYANSPVRPNLSDEIIIIGQYLNENDTNNKNLFFGLKFAPTIKNNNINFIKKLKNNIFIALGGAKGINNLNKCLEAIASIDYIKTVDILESPLNPINGKTFQLRANQKITYLSNLPNIENSLLRAGIVLASYGHLGYQALAQGAALCLIGQKQFQAEYAENLEKSSLCISAGLINNVSVENIIVAIEKTIFQAATLSSNAKQKVDGQGLQRIADIVYNSLS